MNAVNSLANLVSTTNQWQCSSDDCFAAGEEV